MEKNEILARLALRVIFVFVLAENKILCKKETGQKIVKEVLLDPASSSPITARFRSLFLN